MTDLFIAEGYAFQVALECFAEDGIEGFLHDQLKRRHTGNKRRHVHNLLKRPRNTTPY